MHWFESQIEKLRHLAHDYARFRLSQNEEQGSKEIDSSGVRQKFRDALDSLVNEVADQPGIVACLVSYEGLVLAKAGTAPDFEALAAATQECQQTAMKSAKTLALGGSEQLVVIGAEYKFAVIVIGEMALCILSPRAINLSSSLSQKI